jgi:hypothetical protein
MMDGLPAVETLGVAEVTVTGLTNMKLRNVLSKSTPLVDTSIGMIEPAAKSEVVKTSVCGDANDATKILFSRRHKIVPEEGMTDKPDNETTVPPDEGPTDGTMLSSRSTSKYWKFLPEELKSKWLVVTSTTTNPEFERGAWHSMDVDEK